MFATPDNVMEVGGSGFRWTTSICRCFTDLFSFRKELYVGHTIAIDCFTSRQVLNVTVNLNEEVEISLNESRI